MAEIHPIHVDLHLPSQWNYGVILPGNNSSCSLFPKIINKMVALDRIFHITYAGNLNHWCKAHDNLQTALIQEI